MRHTQKTHLSIAYTKMMKAQKITKNFAHNQIENNPDPSVPCRLLLASETGPQITPGTARA